MSDIVKYYHSDLPGAPVLSGTAGALAAVLDACLANGWGLLTAQSASVASGVCTLTFATSHAFEPLTVALVSGAGTAAINGEQRVASTSTNTISFPAPGVPDGPVSGTITAKVAPAGWTKLFAGTNKAAYKSGSPAASGCVVRIDDTGTTTARMRAYESMTDVDTGVGPTPADVQFSGGLYLFKSDSANANSRKWIVVATDKAVLLLTAYYSSYANDYTPAFFGDFPSLKAGDAYNFLVCGETSNSPAQYVGNSTMTGQDGSNGLFIVRSYTQAGGSVPATLRKPGLLSSSGAGSAAPGPNPINGGIEIIPTLVYEGQGTTAPRRGVLPGLYGIPHSLGTSFDSRQQISAVEGLPGHVLIGVRYSTASVSNGYRYAVDVTGPWS